MMIGFKNDILLAQWNDPRLRADLKSVVEKLDSHMLCKYGVKTVVTGIFPEPCVSRASKTHEEGRAIDVRTISWPEYLPKAATDWINTKFSTGIEDMYVGVYHNSGFGWHLHIQCARDKQIIELGED